MQTREDQPQTEVEPRGHRRISPGFLAVIPAVLLIMAVIWRVSTPSFVATTVAPTQMPIPTAQPATSTALPASPTPLPTATPLPPTPTIDATQVRRWAAIAATIRAPIPTDTATPDTHFVNDGGVYRRADGPVTLKIDKIGINAPVESVGLDPTGAMATPTTAFRVAWFDGGPLPGQSGNAVIDGHLDSRIYGEAIFWNLGKLVPGDTIQIEMPGKRWLTFVVDRVAVYPYNDAPLDEIFGPSAAPHLNLITCSGIFDRSSHNYDRRRVVYTSLRSS